jgi:hypothetical protein
MIGRRVSLVGLLVCLVTACAPQNSWLASGASSGSVSNAGAADSSQRTGQRGFWRNAKEAKASTRATASRSRSQQTYGQSPSPKSGATDGRDASNRESSPKAVVPPRGSGDQPREASTPKVGSPEWQREQDEDARKEKRLKQIIQGICRSC